MNIPALVVGYRSSFNIINRVSELKYLGFNPIFLFIDGPVEGSVLLDEVIECQSSARKLLEKQEVTAIYLADENLGQGKAIPTAIEWFLHEVGAGLIVEDDCQISMNAHTYLESVKKVVSDNPDCFGVCLSNLSASKELPRVIHSQRTLFFNSWGWYTTLTKWQSGMIGNPSNLELLAAIKNLSPIGHMQRLLLLRNWYMFLLKKRYRKANTWAFNFTIGVMVKQGFLLMPNTNLVYHLADLESEHVKRVPSWYRHISDSDFSTTLGASGLVVGLDRNYEKFMSKEVHQAGFLNLLKGSVFTVRSMVSKFFR